ncbi:MAG TPA: hypothetical protein VG267_20635 [Terracidiphilus sp.]|jgi:hypothetical protein|nr:hypothetical protein [Terracidiphilus sp.]
MRRPLSILIVALFLFAPLSALLPGAADAQLPACCRRHGAHHCAMASTAAPPSSHQLTAPSHCPLYRTGHLAPTTVFHLALAPAATGFMATRVPPAHSSSPAFRRSRNLSSRGPPSAC